MTTKQFTVRMEAQGGAQVKSELGNVGEAGKAAHDKIAQGAENSGQSTDKLTLDQARASRAFQSLKASIDPAYAAQLRYDRAVKQVQNATVLGLASKQEEARVLAQLRAQHDQTVAAMQRGAVQVAALGTSSGASTMQVANLGAQLNDIGVMLAAGQSPLQLAVQQGTQMNQVFAQMGGGREALRGVAAGFRSMVSPMSLATLGIIAAGAALVQWGRGLIEARRQTSAAQEPIKELTSAMDQFKASLSEYDQYVSRARQSTQSLTDEFGEFADVVRRTSLFLADVSVGRSLETLRTEGAEFFNGLRAAVNTVAEFEAAQASLNRQLALQAEGAQVSSAQIQTFQDVLDGAADAAFAAAGAVGLVPEQVIALDDAFANVRGASSMEALRDAAQEALAQIQGFFPEGMRLPPALHLSVQELEGILRASAKVVHSMDETTNAATRTAQAVASINYSNAVKGAQALAQQMDITLHAALQLMGLLGAAQQTAFNGDALDPRHAQYDTANAKLERTRKIMEDISKETRVATSTFDAFGGTAKRAAGASASGAAAAQDAAQSAINSLRQQIDQERELIGISGNMRAEIEARRQIERALAQDKVAWNEAEINALSEKILLNKKLRDEAESTSRVLGSIAAGIVNSDIGGIGSNILGQGQSSFTTLLQGAFAKGGGGFAGIWDGLKSSALDIGTALSTGVGWIGKLGGAFSAALPIIGGVVTALSFFKSKTVDLDAGLKVMVEGLDRAIVETFLIQEKTRFWGLSKKTIETYSAADAEIANPIQAAIDGIGDRVLALSDTLGLASANLADVSLEFEVSTKDRTDEQIQAAVEAEFVRLGDNYADAVIGSYKELLPDEAEIARIEAEIARFTSLNSAGGRGDGQYDHRISLLEQEQIAAQTAIEVVHLNDAFAGLQQEGEGSLEMLERLVGELGTANDAMTLLDEGVFDISVSGAAAASNLVALSGGIDLFAEKAQFVFDNFLTDAGQNARLTELALDSLNSTFGDLQFAIPATHAEFKALLDAQDLTTEAGRQTYSALTDVAAAFVQVNGTAQGAADALTAAAQAAADVRAAEVVSASAIAANRSTLASEALSDAEAALRAAFSAQSDEVTTSYQDQITAAQASADAARALADASAQTASDRVSLYGSIVDVLESAFANRRVLNAIDEQARLSDATAFLRAALASGGTSDLDQLEQALDAVADPSTALFQSFADYQHDFNVNTNLIERLKEVAGETLTLEQRMLNAAESSVDLSGAQISAIEAARDAELSALDQQLAALLGLDVSVLSITDAIAAFMGAQVAVRQTSGAVAAIPTAFEAGSFGADLDAIYRELLGRGVQQAGLDFYGGLYAGGFGLDQIRSDILGSDERANFLASGIPAFAAGGVHAGGARIVGERGPELELTGPSRIYDANQTKRMLGNDNSEVVAALTRVEQRLQEMQSQNTNLRQEVRDLRKINAKWDTFGKPETRPAPTPRVGA